MTISSTIRELIAERDNRSCVACGRQVVTHPKSLQHRRARKAGGARIAWINDPQNLITVCGSATSADCHFLKMEKRPADAEDLGYVISEWPEIDPRFIPVRIVRWVVDELVEEWMWLTPEGGRYTYPPDDLPGELLAEYIRRGVLDVVA